MDLGAYPGLVMVILGFKAHRLRAWPALLRLGKGFAEMRRNPPDSLLGE